MGKSTVEEGKEVGSDQKSLKKETVKIDDLVKSRHSGGNRSPENF